LNIRKPKDKPQPMPNDLYWSLATGHWSLITATKS
jgi:hypothetical protein